ncbi:hypothetical protein [Pseudomonas aeruginosa]|uniref:hypothetical protein n=1 Tax=Pseudomonas aeruginosa TaxID=287 RepID=UPI000DEF7934|nr:hypothetical protein [Pseudomonas aeruginosa]MCO1763865.1 hypothetical protein [Pseudomonas aeruginosa]MCS7938892.1 hypothetical protein [Pseudomonas aeruginosa]MCV4037232.1 hypothetical protein [Pseudomonas aeruginosa]QYE69891.1 hypothetical protein KZ798_18385 [Pseudomonas aeruginosa]RCN12907.1 hypothetical protein C3O68_00525 [Pseudomonas aeruginosa]
MTQRRRPPISSFFVEDSLSFLLKEKSLDRRRDIWLWFYLALRDTAVYHPENIIPANMRDRMAESIEKFGVTTDLLGGNQNYLLIPEKHFSWISESERQLSWIKRRLPRGMADERIYSPALSERDLLIATIDCAESPPREKTSFLANLKRAWDEQQQLDQQLDWIKEGDEREACRHVWEWLSKHLSNQVFLNPRPESYQHLLITLDTFTWSPKERGHYISTVRRLWRQKLRRQEAKGKKQYNFILSDKAIKRLDRFTKDHELSRARVLEILLQMEDEKDLYLKEQIRVLRGIEL